MTENGLPKFDLTHVIIQDRMGNKRSVPTRMAGSGQPIIFLHGYPLDGRMWEPVMARLSDKFRCIAPDLRGFGKADEENHSFSMADLAGDVYGLIKALGVANKVAVCGLSMGGYVAMQFASLYPDLLSRLLLTNTRGNADDASGRQTRIDTAKNVLQSDVTTVVSPMLEKLLAPRTLKSEPELVELVQEMMFQTKRSTVAWAQLAMANRPDSLSAMQGWKFPTLCIAGEHDPITPPAALEAIYSALGCDESLKSFQIDPQSSHLTPLESPDWFAKKISDLFAM